MYRDLLVGCSHFVTSWRLRQAATDSLMRSFSIVVVLETEQIFPSFSQSRTAHNAKSTILISLFSTTQRVFYQG